MALCHSSRYLKEYDLFAIRKNGNVLIDVIYLQVYAEAVDITKLLAVILENKLTDKHWVGRKVSITSQKIIVCQIKQCSIVQNI